jgi:SAM-dependent methyltransferase
MSNAREAFSRIYEGRVWGGTSASGPGSDPHVLAPYVNLLTDFVRANNVRSVVDIGCGDWAFTQAIDWSGVDYTGIDIVPDLVSQLNGRFGRPNVRFVCRDLIADQLPAADLCVVKDVLQHLPNESVARFLARLPDHFERALVTNDISHRKRGGWRRLWRTVDRIEPNGDIAAGSYRPLRLSDAPFHLAAARVALLPLRFRRPLGQEWVTVLETKEVLLWERRRAEGGQPKP